MNRENQNRRRIPRPVIAFAVLIVVFVIGGCSIWSEGNIATEDAEETAGSQTGGEAIQDAFETETVEPVHSNQYECYAYDQLDEDTRKVYDEIVDAIESRAESTTLSTTDFSVMEKAYQAIRYDHCEYFWLQKFSYVTYSNRKEEVTEIEFTPEFSVSETEQAELQTQIDDEAARLLANAPLDGSDFDKVLYVYDTLIREVDYDINAENNQNLISTFIGHRTVCQGYSYGTQYLLHQLGVPCTTIEGTTEDGNHSWNLVKMDGEYYYVDLTWGNSQYTYFREDAETESAEKFVDYSFMGADSETILETRTPSDEIPLPACTATADNYYVHEGLYFSEWNPDEIGTCIGNAYDNDDESIQIKFSDMELHEQAMQYFLEDYHIMDYCPGLAKIQYIENSDNQVLFLLFDT